MILGIIGAMSEELEILLNDMELEDTKVKAKMTFHKGKLWGKDVVAVVCGIGKVNAAVCTQLLISEYEVTHIVNVGVAGGIGKEIYPGDVVVATNLVQYDMDTTAFGDPMGQIPRLDTFDFKCDEHLIEVAKAACDKAGDFNTFSGRIVSGDMFVASLEKIQWLEKEFGALSCEMEGASIAQVCFLSHIPFLIIRSISDIPGGNNVLTYEEFLDKSSKKVACMMNEILKNV